MPSDKQDIQNFILKVWRMVNDRKTDQWIRWNQETGRSFVITDQTEFAKRVLPLYFKHQNMPSFIRQLNMYGFRKVMNVDHMGLATSTNEIEFLHHNFSINSEDELKLIKRKMPTKTELVQMKPEDMNEIYHEIESMKQKQSTFNSVLLQLKNQNEMLWGELAIQRQKHKQQQQIVEKMLTFLAQMVSNKKNMVFDGQGLKRKAPMLLDNVSPSKTTKMTNNGTPSSSTSGDEFNASSPGAPRIFEICDNDIVNILPQDQDSHGGYAFSNDDSTKNPALISSARPSPPPTSNGNVNSPQQQQQQQQQHQPSTSSHILDMAIKELQEGQANQMPSMGSNNITVEAFQHEPTVEDEVTLNNPTTDLVLSTPNNLALVHNYQNIYDHIDGMDTELAWLQDQTYFNDYDFDPGMLEYSMYDQDNHLQAPNDAMAPLNTPMIEDGTKSLVDNKKQISDDDLFDNIDLRNIMANGGDDHNDDDSSAAADSKLLDSLDLALASDSFIPEEANKILATNDLDSNPQTF